MAIAMVHTKMAKLGENGFVVFVVLCELTSSVQIVMFGNRMLVALALNNSDLITRVK